MDQPFKDKVVIITGASGGIGLETARLLLKAGAHVVLASRNKEKLDSLASEMTGVLAVPTDVTQDSSVDNMVAQTLQKYGRIDILVNNAGILYYKPMADTTPSEIRALMETNYYGAVRCTNAVLPSMKKQKHGMIINVASIAGRVGFPKLGYYC
jgi:NADP-dependent 3-hydroxy acid dehydrogenase YdfG